MFYIGICDDNELHRKHIRMMCDRFFENGFQEYKCVEFATGEELLRFAEHKIHLLFLDIELGEMRGIDILEALEENDDVRRIVFVSNYEEFVFDTFGIKTLSFERKPAQYERVAKWITVALKENKESVVYECFVNQEKKCFALEEIYYLEASGNYVNICLKADKYMGSDRLKLWMDKMKCAPMVRIHKSYLVNMLHIKSWEADKVILTNGMELSQGRQYKKAAKERYHEFIGNMARERM